MRLRLTILLLAVPLAVAWADDPAPKPPRALLVNPAATEAYYQSIEATGSAEAEVALWRNWLGDVGFNHAGGSEKDVLNTRGLDVIILPGALALSNSQIDSLFGHLERGGGLLITGATGVRTERGDWRGYSVLEAWLGAAPLPVTEMPLGEPASLMIRYGQPGTTRIPPGYHLRITPYGEPLYMPATHRGNTGAFWANDGYHDENPLNTQLRVAEVTRELPNGGRIAWLGSTLEGLHLDDRNMEQANKFFPDLLLWLAGNPTAGIEPWPEGRDVGMLVHGDIEDQFDRVQSAVDLFTRLGIPTTYNLLVNEAVNYPEIVDAMLASRGELAIHGDNHDHFAGQEFRVQHERLSTGVDFIQRKSSYPSGFRPPELAYDSTTVEVLINLGFEYLSADNTPDRYYPRFRPNDKTYLQVGGLTFFPKSELDDYDFFGKYDVRSASGISRMMIADFDRIRLMHGLYKLNYHSQFLGNGELLGAMESAIRYGKEHAAWIATAREISRWVWQREMLELTSRYENGLIYLDVTNPSELSLRDVVLRVLPPEGGLAEQMAPKSTSRRSTYDVKDGAFFLYLPVLQAGETYSATLIGGSRAGISAAKKRNFIYTMIGLGVIALSVIGWAAWYFLIAKRKDVHARSEENDSDEEDEDIPALPKPNVRTPAQAVRNPRGPTQAQAVRPKQGRQPQQTAGAPGPRRSAQGRPPNAARGPEGQRPPQGKRPQPPRQQAPGNQPLFTATSVGPGEDKSHLRDQASPGLFYIRNAPGQEKEGMPPDPRAGSNLSLRSTSGRRQTPTVPVAGEFSGAAPSDDRRASPVKQGGKSPRTTISRPSQGNVPPPPAQDEDPDWN